MIRAVIIDDEPLGVNTLEMMIGRLQLEVTVSGTATEPEKGKELIESQRPDVVFLDVNMPGLNGFQLLEKLMYKNFKLVFVTAHQEHAIKAIRSKAHDYLLKPIDAADLKACMESIIGKSKSENSSQRSRSVLELPVSDGIVMIKQSNIIRLEASGSYTTIYLKTGIRHQASMNLKYFESILDPASFCRCHRSHIVNLHEVSKLMHSDGYYNLMSDGSKADVGKNYKDLLLSKMKDI
jgi:two-component system, LytTR family, response regulator